MEIEVLEELGLPRSLLPTIIYTLQNRHPVQAEQQAGFLRGSFDVDALEITSSYSKHLTDNPANPHSKDSIEAWATMIHEWVHFMQFSSSTLGLHITLNRLRQQVALTRLCLAISKETRYPTLFIPLLEAATLKIYPATLRPHLTSFLTDWFSAERLLLANQGIWVGPDGRGFAKTLPTALLPNLRRSAHLADRPVTLLHILEPIAVGCQGQWLLQTFGADRGLAEQSRLISFDDASNFLPLVEADLGINYSTRMILHDLALLPPVEFSNNDARSPNTPERYAATSRLLASLELLATHRVDHVNDSDPVSYIRLASDLGKILDWPPPDQLVEDAIRYVGWCKTRIDEIDALRMRSSFVQLFDDFERAFQVRKQHQDAFVCLTEPAAALYQAGWQPVWRLSDGWCTHESQSPDEALARLRIVLLSKINRSFVLGGRWHCPLQTICESRGSGCELFPSSDCKGCHCREAVHDSTGFLPEQIQNAKTAR